MRQLAELLVSIGYTPEINLGDLDKSQRKKVDKKLIYQLGVAGFGFGNVMLCFGCIDVYDYDGCESGDDVVGVLCMSALCS